VQRKYSPDKRHVQTAPIPGGDFASETGLHLALHFRLR